MNAVLILGCGDVGRRVARACQAAGAPVTGLVRSPQSAVQLRDLGIEALEADLDRPLPPLPSAGTELYYFAPPPTSGDRDPRMAAVLAALERDGLPRRIVYISTSAVYGDCGGAWIDEDAPLRPDTRRGLRRLDAERQLKAWSERTGIPVVILRVPGIYGPGRLPLERLRKGLPLLREDQCPYTNRIHADDLAAICLAAMVRGVSGTAYNVSDGHPSNMVDYFNRIADRAGLPRPPTLDREEAEQQLTPGMLGYMQESKRLRNERMLNELGISLQYPDLEAGLDSCFIDS
ncbi:MAG: SDR family oxidoreductase [Xanthomonadaceae bacterium]|nr:SDR family oxidoreductase [Xanthomonadaceae bacterium]